MCQYCGCQSVAAVDLLTREHDAVVALFAPLRAAAAVRDLTGVAAVAKRVAVLLEPHTEVEEVGLFPLMETDHAEHIARLRHEHEVVESVLDEVISGELRDDGWPTRLTDMLDLLQDHILAEQDGVFPAALTGLSGEEWDAVDAVRGRVGTALVGDGSADLADDSETVTA